MFLSKIFRGLDENDYRPFVFSSFDQPEIPAATEKKWDQDLFLEEQSNASSKAIQKTVDDTEKIEKAFSEGKEEGLKESHEKFSSTINALGSAVEEISQLRKNIIQNSSQDMLQLALTIARQVLHCEISVKPETILASIERALTVSVSTDSYQVRVNPQDLELVQENKPFFLARISGLKNITFEGDDSISRGGCRVESELGEVDAAIETQLDEIKQYLLASIAG